LVPPLLAFAIPFNRFRMLRPVVRKIVGMSLTPLLLAVVGDLAIFRIYFELFSVIVGTPPALTLWSAADGLLWTIKRTKKTTLAVETAAVLAHDDSSEILQDESLRNNQMASNVQILEAYLEFLLRPCQRALVDHWPRPTPAITAPFFAGADSKGHYGGSLVDAHFGESLGGTEISFDQVTDLFSELIFAYLAGNFNFARRLPSSGGPRGISGSTLLTSCESFAIAHEYGHVIAGHISPEAIMFARTPVGSVKFVRKSHEQELQPDRLAGQLVLRSQVRPGNTSQAGVKLDVMFSFAGPLVFLSLDGLVSEVEQELAKRGIVPGFEETHPLASHRAEALKKMYGNLHPAARLQEFTDLANSCEWWLTEVSRGIREQIEVDAEMWFKRRVQNVFELWGLG